MNFDINGVEWFWLGVNGTTFVITLWALFDARGDRRAVMALDGPARDIAADASVRREVLRLIVQALFLALVVPSLFAPGEVKLSALLFILIGVPVVLLISTALDARDRKRIKAIIYKEVAQREAAKKARLHSKTKPSKPTSSTEGKG